MPPPHRAHSYIQTQHGKKGKVGVIRETGRTADSIGEYLTYDYSSDGTIQP